LFVNEKRNVKLPAQGNKEISLQAAGDELGGKCLQGLGRSKVVEGAW